MKQINVFFLMLMGMITFTFSSCNSSQSFVVKGLPGTVIYNSQNQQVGIIDNSGKSEIRMSRGEGYYHYLQAQAPGSSMLVPFALDYNNHSRALKRNTAKGLGYVLAGAGAFACFVAGITAISEGSGNDEGAFEEVGAPFLYGGAGGLLLGSILWLVGSYNDGIDSDYDYQKQQITNNDIQRW